MHFKHPIMQTAQLHVSFAKGNSWKWWLNIDCSKNPWAYIKPIENNSGCFIKPRGLTGLQYYWYLIHTPTEAGSRQTLCNQHLPGILLSLLFSYNASGGSIYTMSRNVHHTLYADGW